VLITELDSANACNVNSGRRSVHRDLSQVLAQWKYRLHRIGAEGERRSHRIEAECPNGLRSRAVTANGQLDGAGTTEAEPMTNLDHSPEQASLQHRICDERKSLYRVSKTTVVRQNKFRSKRDIHTIVAESRLDVSEILWVATQLYSRRKSDVRRDR
jgi:hypothetical protein